MNQVTTIDGSNDKDIRSIHQLVESYLNARSAILRTLEERDFSSSEMKILCGFNFVILLRRRQKPGLWRPDELRRLAHGLKLPTRSIDSLEVLATHLKLLSDKTRLRLFKGVQLNNHKWTIRQKNHCSWQYEELLRMSVVLTCFKESVSA